MKREYSTFLVGWLVLVAFLFGVGWQNLFSPGLYYDEALFGRLAKDFLTGHATGSHQPGVQVMEISGRPFPLFAQPHMGALKCWLLMPLFKLISPTVSVMRGANLALEAMALLVCMLWMWRLLGLAEAMLMGLLLASDPAFLFSGMLDSGSDLPGLLCRLSGLLLALAAWRRQNFRLALVSGLAFGLGIFNRADAGLVVGGMILATIYSGGRAIRPAIRAHPGIFLGALLGFLTGAALTFVPLGKMVQTVHWPNDFFNPSNYSEAFRTFGALYDGSYFYRLMDAGGVWDKMYQTSAPVWTPFGIAVLVAALALIADIIRSTPENPGRRTKIFLLLSTAFITGGAMLFPGGLQIHHAVMAYPFPHALVACAVAACWKRHPSFSGQKAACGAAMALAGLLFICNCLAVYRTQALVRETGGRGWWSNQLERFAAETGNRRNITVVSLDWGFNEQLEFLPHESRLVEPFRQVDLRLKGEFPRDPRFIYLVHPPEYSLSPVGTNFMDSVARDGTNAVVQPWRDGQGRIAFYSISFKAP